MPSSANNEPQNHHSPPSNHHPHHPQPQNHHPHHPQPQNHQPHHYSSHNRYHSSSSKASFRGCCCCLFLLITFLGLLILAVILVILLAVKPKKPQFELEQVGVQYVGITPTASPITTPSASLSLTIRMVFTAVNPNKVGIKYSSMEFYVMYRGVPLGVASVPGFYQPSHSTRRIQTLVSVDKVNLMQADATNLIRDASLKDRVELKVTGDVGAKIRILDFTSPKVKVSVNCAVVISPRRQSLSYKQCGVDSVNV